MQDHSDKELVALFRNPDRRNYAFGIIVRKYQEKLYWHIRKMVIVHDDADDILQEVFIKVWKYLENFREESQLYTWIYRIATNETLTFLKDKKRKFMLPIINIENNLLNQLEGDTFIDGDELQIRLQKAILKLPEKQRLVFNMRYFDEIKYSDMAEILNTSEGALKASYHHAAKKIEDILKNN